MSVGLTQLLPQALRQRRHCKLSGAVEVGVGAVDDAVSTHAAGGSRRGSKTLSLAGPFYPLTCRGDYKTPPVYVNDVTVVDIPLLHRLISLTCADAQCENVDLGEEPAKRGQGGLTPFYDVRLSVSSSYVQHVFPAAGFAAQQRIRVSQAGVVDADVNSAVLLFDGGEHGQNLFLVGQVALERQQDSAEALAKALGGQFLEQNQ